MFVFVITHHTAGNFLSCKEFPLSCLNAKGKKLQRTCLVMMSYDMYHDSKRILKKKSGLSQNTESLHVNCVYVIVLTEADMSSSGKKFSHPVRTYKELKLFMEQS